MKIFFKKSFFKIVLPVVVLSFLFLINFEASAHPGRTDSSGCHTCRTNCASWGLYTGEYHCHNAKSSYQPLSPVTSTWGDGGTGYTSPAPEYNYPSVSYLTTPSCPLHSSYNSISKNCKCNYGYLVSTDFMGDQSCISGTSYCYDKYGYNSKYDSLSKTCECNYGYVFKNDKCISEDDYCSDLYGRNSEYNILTSSCDCKRGYVFTKDMFGNLECVSGSSYCSDKYGYNSRYSSLYDKCECKDGYEIINGSCQKKENETLSNIGYSSLLFPEDDKECGINSSLNGDGTCSCSDGYEWTDKSNEKDLDCKKIIIVCLDLVNGYLNEDNKCYCNKGYIWDKDNNKCKKEIVKKIEVTFRDKIKNFIKEEKEEIIIVDDQLSEKLKGKILLQIENHGEAWYINPKNKKKYYMANGKEAYNVMRYLGVGITNDDLEKIKTSKIFAKRHSGKIFLQIESFGQAYYIDFDGDSHYLENGEKAYEVMRNLGLGITNIDLRKIDISEV